MHITRVELEDIKSHTRSRFEFARGSTAITGENGSGKTTIIEAIAWTLFDVLDYKKDDFLRRGAKKGVARVSFESSLDEREYTVHRDTGTGYYVIDPALEHRLADKKEEVVRFLWQHLGVEPGTDLESLFKQAIGVPQGTLTAVFFATPAERKRTFDTLLKVEEYRRSADELLKTARYVEQQMAAADVKIARAEGEIARTGAVEAELSNAAAEAKEFSALVGALERESAARSEAVRHLDAAEKRSLESARKHDAARSTVEKLQLILAQRASELERSREAAAIVERFRPEANLHRRSLGRVKELERERGEREKLDRELVKIEGALTNVETERKHLTSEIERIQESHHEIAKLTPLAAEHEQLDALARKLRTRVAEAEAAAQNAKAADERLERLRNEFRANAELLKGAKESSAAAAELESLQRRDAELVRELAGLEAALERDEAFQREIRNGLCPILSEKCLNLKDGQTLEMFVTSQFGELRSRIDIVRQEQTATAAALKTSREAERTSAQLPMLEKREAELRDEGERAKAERAALDTEILGLVEVRAELAGVEMKLAELGDVKAKIRLLEQEVKREAQVREQISKSEKNTERLESDRRITVEKLESYKDLDMHWREAVEQRDSTAEAYRNFLANEASAGRVNETASALKEAERDAAAAAEKAAELQTAAELAAKEHDRELHAKERAALSEVEKRLAEQRARADLAEKRVGELTAELARLKEVREAMHLELRERERLGKTSELTEFIRTTLKEAAPLVASNYVLHVSAEANNMFREITGNAERTLKWAEDYGIILEEGGYERPFQSLSGGEQMAAALSVRLALLKQLSDIRIAFFDEPTANMDAERRENLAQQIGQIKHFDQLFVISHDDTFEGYMDHEVRVGE